MNTFYIGTVILITCELVKKQLEHFKQTYTDLFFPLFLSLKVLLIPGFGVLSSLLKITLSRDTVFQLQYISSCCSFSNDLTLLNFLLQLCDQQCTLTSSERTSYLGSIRSNIIHSFDHSSFDFVAHTPPSKTETFAHCLMQLQLHGTIEADFRIS